MKKKILLAIVPIFIITIGIYSVSEIFRTLSSYKKDFDDSIKSSMYILGPTLSFNLYNVERGASKNSLKAIFANKNIEKIHSSYYPSVNLDDLTDENNYVLLLIFVFFRDLRG
jgi:hypothetical protein